MSASESDPVSNGNSSESDATPVDPAAAAVDHHLGALDRDRFNAEPAPLGRPDALRRRLADHSPAVLDLRAIDADRHLALALRALSERVARIASWQHDDHDLAADLQRSLHQAAEQIERLAERDDALSDRIDALAAQLQTTERTQREELAALRIAINRVSAGSETVAQLLRGGPVAGETGDDPSRTAAIETVLADAHEDFYRQLEQRFRGSRAHIKALTAEYLDDVRPIGGPVVDIGCGTGEWLELLGEEGITAYGVDTNAAFAEANRARGLDVRVGDAVAHLASLEPGTLGAVTGFHLAEHLETELLLRLIDRARVALRPGGLLILETPNPTNVRVGAAQFWIDPTHIRPLHPELLAFMCTQRGFAEVETRPLHPGRHHEIDWGAALGLDVETGSPASEILDDLREAMAGGQDYAVLARAT